MKSYEERGKGYIKFNFKHVKDTYPLLFELFGDEGIKEIAQLELDLTEKYEEKVPERAKEVLENLPKELLKTFDRNQLLEYITEEITKQKLEKGLLPISFYTPYFLEYTDESLRYLVNNCGMGVKELHHVLKVQNAENYGGRGRCPVFYPAKKTIDHMIGKTLIDTYIEKGNNGGV